MKSALRLTVFAALLAVSAAASAQLVDDVAIGFNPRTGDAWVDARLGDINVFATGNTEGFIDDVVVSYGAPRVLVRELYFERHWAPGDIYYACELASMLGRPCLEIVDIYERDRGQGWGVIAQRLGIKPGSAEFHAMKGRVGRGHDRMKGNAGRGGNRGNGNSGGDDRGNGNSGNRGNSERGNGNGDRGNGNGNRGNGRDKGGRG
jgi:hypothetical protein